MMNKKLLRQIKQEGIGNIDYDNEVLENALIYDYNMSNGIPLKYWSYEELKTRYEELVNTAYKLSVLFPEYYRNEWYYNNSEQWDILDEMQNIAQSYNIDIYGE